jgi:hypothetical protein
VADPSVLDPDLRLLLDGGDVTDHVGQTLLLVSTGDDGWPHVAMLSVGEVVAVSATDLRLALYPGSGTTAAVRASGQALIMAVVDGVPHKVTVRCTELPTDGSRLAAFDAHVVRSVRDEVPYARVLHGIEYELVDPGPVVERWYDQVAWLRGIEGSGSA